MKQVTKRFRSIIAVALSLTMAFTSLGLPMGMSSVVHAATNDPIYVLAGGDYQQAGDHANSAENVKNILAQISQKYTTMNGFLFIGDYDCETHDSATETAKGIASLMDTVDNTYSNINHANSVLVQGNHDYKDSNIDATGGHDFDGYSVYVLNEDDYPNNGGSQSQIQTLADNLESWLNNKLGEGYDAPVFITSHLPLAFTPRTVTQGDAKYAKLIFDVLNTAADNGLNIIFLHGHDHAYGPDNYMGGEAVYLPKGDKIAIAETGSTSTFTWETLNFTYMNAGYTGYYSDPYTYVTDAGTDKLTMTVFKIENNQVTVERYSANGLYNLKSAGYDGSYSNTSVTNQSLGLGILDAVYASPQTIELNSNNNDEVGTINQYVGVEAETPADDVTTSNKGWVEVVAPVNNELTEDVTTSGSSWVTLTQPSGGTTTYNYTWDTNGKDDDKAYLIVNGTSTTVLENNETSGVSTATITSNDGTTATATTQDYEWKIDSSNRISTTINNRVYYLQVTTNWNMSSLSLNTNSNRATEWTISNDNGSYTISYAPYGNYGDTYHLTTSGISTTPGTVRLYYYQNSTQTDASNGLYAYLNGDLRYTITAGMTAEQAVQMVKGGIDIQFATATNYSDEDTVDDDGNGMSWTLDSSYDPNAPGDYAVTIAYNGTTIGVAEVIVPAKDDVPGTYYKLAGDLTYNATVGMTADEAMALVKAGIDGYYHNAMSTPDDSVTGSKVDDSVLTWEWVDTFDGNTAGDYAVSISYNGKLLGTAEVVVPASKTYYIAEGNGMYYVDMNATADTALATVKAGVTVSSATDEKGSNKQTIDDSLVTWNWVDTYNGADSGPYTVEILYNETSLGTVEVKVNVKYETGINSDWTYIKDTEATGGTYTYTLDTDGIDYGEEHKYIIVDDNEAIVLNANSASNGTAHNITISGNTATLTTRDYEFHMIQSTYENKRYELITKGNGSQYLYQESNGVRYGTRSSVKFQVNHHGNGVYDIHDIDGTNWYIIYNGSWTVTETTSARVRLYKYTGSTGGTPAGKLYAKLEGNTLYTVEQGTSSYEALATVRAGITAYTATDANGTNKTEIADSELTYKWKNTYTSMVTGSYWVEISYNGVVLGTVEVQVKPGVINNYPEYPDEGAVKVNKTATGINFQSSGIAQIEISASGVPMKRGADVIVMLDTSSSMAYCLNCNDTRHSTYVCDQGGKTRAQALEESLGNLITQFKTPGDDGQLMDIRVAIADFNGFYGDGHNATGTPYDRDAADTMQDGINYTANSQAKIYTGDGTLGAGAFANVEDLANSYTLNYTSGTNYDYAMDAIYQMGTAVKSNDRDLFVIFMSDGAAMQWNYYHSQGASNQWENWITGAWTADQLTSSTLGCTTHKYYYDEVDHDGDGIINEHRMANAIKGNPNESFEVIRKTATLGTKTEEENMYNVSGLGAKMFSIAFDPRVDTNVEVEHMVNSIKTLATDDDAYTQYFWNVNSADALANAFTSIGSSIAYAAYNSRYVDQMGDDYNLKMGSLVDLDGNSLGVDNKIEIISYDIYTRQDFLNGTITEDKIGDRKGTYTVLETVTFNADGTEAYSSLNSIGPNGTITAGQNILIDGVIYANTFWYNTNISAVEISGVDIPTGTNPDDTTSGSTDMLPSETFYWKLGTVQSSELALRYFVYLEGSMEGTKEAGSYPTNEYATLYYDNYLNNPCYKETVSPIVAWESANVSYAFYLVNEKGEIIVNQTTGLTGSFANKIAVTNPVVYQEILLNNTDVINSIEVASSGVLPTGYDLYDTDSVYTIKIDSDATGEWTIAKGTDTVASTYVTNYDPSNATAYTNDLTSKDSADYTHTVVWFAVLWKTQALPDSVVIDYGLPVDISVLANDMFGEYGKLASVGPYSDSLNLDGHDTNLASGFTTSYTSVHGTAVANADTGKVRYTPKDKYMQMDGYDKFAYAVNYTGTVNAGYYYDTVTVIPATSIYYEDSFLTLEASNTSWLDEGTVVNGATQSEDRPGEYSLTDANNIYGYDSVNKGMSTFSLGTAKKIHVDASSWGKASFEFIGTGFDIISMTSNTTGTLVVKITPYVNDEEKTENAKQYIVDTYYGYSYDENSGWVANPTNPNALYQIPVIQIDGLEYGKYKAELIATYADFFDHTTTDGYDLYIDAVRIYNSANNGANNSEDTTIIDAYKADREAWPDYIELRSKLIDSKTLGNANTTTVINGLVFIDGDSEVDNSQIADYQNYGPNNEVYLAPGQRVAFILDLDATNVDIANVHIGVKAVNGQKGTYTITNIAQKASDDGKVDAGDYYNPRTYAIDTATDMYYDLTSWKNDIVVITNTGNRPENNTTGIISITDIKVTYNSDPTIESNSDSILYMTPSAAMLTLRTLNTKEPTVFTPETFEVSTDNVVKQGDNTSIKVITSSEVVYLYANNEEVTEYVDNGDGTRTWTFELPADTVGEITVEIVGADSNNVLTAPVTTTVVVEEKVDDNVGNKDDIVNDKVDDDIVTKPDDNHTTNNETMDNDSTSNEEDDNKQWEDDVDGNDNLLDSEITESDSKSILEIILEWIMTVLQNIMNLFNTLFGKGRN